MGKTLEAITEAINGKASIALANKAEERGVGYVRFCVELQHHGAAECRPRRESDPLNPLTAYARSKVAMEDALRETNSGNMTVTCLRLATACGMSDRLRLDLVLKEFVASAPSTGEITVLSDGTPRRPLIDMADMARAIEWAIDRSPENGGRFLVVHAGSNKGNYWVRELAEAVAVHLPDTNVGINPTRFPISAPIRLTCRCWRNLHHRTCPIRSLGQSIESLCIGLRGMGFSDREFRNSSLTRLKTLNQHIAEGRLSTDPHWP